MRGSKTLITSEDVQRKIAQNVCTMEAVYSCIFNHPDDQMCMMNKVVFTECMQNMEKNIIKPESTKK